VDNNNNKIDLRERGWDGVDLTDLAQGRNQWRAPVNMVNCWEVLE
jgi:hypothetical protein